MLRTDRTLYMSSASLEAVIGTMEMAMMLSATLSSVYEGSKIMLVLVVVRRRVIGGCIDPDGVRGGGIGVEVDAGFPVVVGDGVFFAGAFEEG